jgi:two-component system chemotaxis response regulator CheB
VGEEAAVRLVVLGASAGGPLALGDVLAGLPDDLDAAVAVVLHLLAGRRSLLANVLARRTSLPVAEALDGAVLRAGHVYVAPPDMHLRFRRSDRTIALDPDPPVQHHRPSIDVTFASAADAYEAGAVAVILTGTGSDGAAGVVRVDAAGGTVVAQGDGAEYDAMPRAAIRTGCVHRILPLAEIAPAIVELTGLVAA